MTDPVRDVFNEQAEQLARLVGATADPTPIANVLRAAASGRGPYGHVDPGYPLTPTEIERLAIVAEEAGEVVQSIGKILRFGWSNGQHDNRQQLEEELGDIAAAVDLMADAGIIRLEKIDEATQAKLSVIHRRLRY